MIMVRILAMRPDWGSAVSWVCQPLSRCCEAANEFDHLAFIESLRDQPFRSLADRE